MKNIFVIFLIALAVGCNNAQEENSEKDSVIVDTTAQTVTPDTIVYSDTANRENTTQNNSSLPDISGVHDFTLQWIGWDRPGKIHFTKTDIPDTYTVKGEQVDRNTGYIKIEGEIKMISPLELSFDGVITINLTGPYDEGLECQKKGQQTFLSTKNRKYWRMQNMNSCYNNSTVDYIDIYF